MANNTYSQLKAVLDNYGVKVRKITAETLKGDKAVWWVETDSSKCVLKKVPASRERLFFLLSAISHLRANGVYIPAVKVTRDNKQFAEHDGNIYILMEAVNGKAPSYTAAGELSLIMQGMAAFHRASRHFTPPPGAKIRTHLGDWEKSYRKMIAKLDNFRKQALLKKEKPFEQFYLAHCDYFIKEGRACLERLKNPPYHNWVAKVRKEKNLCHQDFAAGNLGLVEGKLYVYDIDSITFDLPARDLRKILNKVMKKRGQWDITLTTQMLGSYHQVNQLTADEYSVVFTDIRFPHLFHGIASKYFENREPDWAYDKYFSRLMEMTKVEKSKEAVLEKQDQIIRSVLSSAGRGERRN